MKSQSPTSTFCPSRVRGTSARKVSRTESTTNTSSLETSRLLVLRDAHGVYPDILLYELRPLGDEEETKKVVSDPTPKRVATIGSMSALDSEMQLMLIEGVATELAATSPWIAEHQVISTKNEVMSSIKETAIDTIGSVTTKSYVSKKNKKVSGGSYKKKLSNDTQSPGPVHSGEKIVAVSEIARKLNQERTSLCAALATSSSISKDNRIMSISPASYDDVFKSVTNQDLCDVIIPSMILFGRHTKLPRAQRLLHRAISRIHAGIVCLKSAKSGVKSESSTSSSNSSEYNTNSCTVCYLLLPICRNAIFINGVKQMSLEQQFVMDAAAIDEVSNEHEKRNSKRERDTGNTNITSSPFYELKPGDVISFLESTDNVTTVDSISSMLSPVNPHRGLYDKLSAPPHRCIPLPVFVVTQIEDKESDYCAGNHSEWFGSEYQRRRSPSVTTSSAVNTPLKIKM